MIIITDKQYKFLIESFFDFDAKKRKKQALVLLDNIFSNIEIFRKYGYTYIIDPDFNEKYSIITIDSSSVGYEGINVIIDHNLSRKILKYFGQDKYKYFEDWIRYNFHIDGPIYITVGGPELRIPINWNKQ